jgi:hypothetical protein
MDNFSKSQDQQLDDQLSEFTDRVLSSDENDSILREGIKQDELMELQKTALRLKAAVQIARMGGATNARIRTRLSEEWEIAKQAEHQTPKRFNWNWSLPRTALAGGFAILIIFGVITLLNPLASPLIGTADGSQVWTPLFILVGVVIIVLLLWRDRYK